MTNERDMEAPVTRREMYEALEIWGGALRAEIAELRTELRTMYDGIVRVMREELRRHSNANKEDLERGVAAVDDKYNDLPPRVRKLEAKVFAKRAAKAKARPRR